MAKPRKPKPKPPKRGRPSKPKRGRPSKPKRKPKRKSAVPGARPPTVLRTERIRARAKLAESQSDRLFGALEMIRDVFARETGVDVTLQARRPPDVVRGTPWAMVGRFVFGERVYYADLMGPFEAMEGSARLERKIGAQRLARVQARYELAGDRSEYTLAEIGPWELVISRCVERCNPDGDRSVSLAARYKEDAEHLGETGTISSILIWLSSVTAQEVDLGVPF